MQKGRDTALAGRNAQTPLVAQADILIGNFNLPTFVVSGGNQDLPHASCLCDAVVRPGFAGHESRLRSGIRRFIAQNTMLELCHLEKCEFVGNLQEHHS
jgi:hypothetical protein